MQRGDVVRGPNRGVGLDEDPVRAIDAVIARLGHGRAWLPGVPGRNQAEITCQKITLLSQQRQGGALGQGRLAPIFGLHPEMAIGQELLLPHNHGRTVAIEAALLVVAKPNRGTDLVLRKRRRRLTAQNLRGRLLARRQRQNREGQEAEEMGLHLAHLRLRAQAFAAVLFMLVISGCKGVPEPYPRIQDPGKGPSRPIMIFSLLALAAFPLPAQEKALAAEPTPHQRLHEAVSLPTAKARAKAAKALARDREISLEEWLAVMQGFGIFPEVESGVQTVHVPLRIDGKEEKTELVLYVPSAYDAEKAWPLLMLLHGSGGDGMGMARNWQAFAEKHGYLLLAPTDPESGKGYAFRERERQAGLAALRWMRLQYHVDENRIHLHGVSRGGHMAWDLGTRFPDLFASLVPAIGGPTWTLAKGRNNLRMVENLHRMPIRDLQGAQDDAHLLRNLRQAFTPAWCPGPTSSMPAVAILGPPRCCTGKHAKTNRAQLGCASIVSTKPSTNTFASKLHRSGQA